MYRKIKSSTHRIKRNTSYQGETIEQKINRIVNNKEPIKDGAPLIYTERKEGVRADMNIRTDKWEVAVDAMDAVARAQMDDRGARLEGFKNSLDRHNKKLEEKAKKAKEGDGGTESAGGPDPK